MFKPWSGKFYMYYEGNALHCFIESSINCHVLDENIFNVAQVGLTRRGCLNLLRVAFRADCESCPVACMECAENDGGSNEACSTGDLMLLFDMSMERNMGYENKGYLAPILMLV